MSLDPQTTSNRRLSRTSHHAQHRARQHDQAHDNTALPGPVLEHPLVYAGEPLWVNTPEQLRELLHRLHQSGCFAFDTEFIGEHTYHPRLCLLQTATSDLLALVDPLADLDLLPFWELVADASVIKLVHAGLQDLEPVYRHLGRPGRNLFDVQIAAGLLGQAYPSSLVKLMDRFLQVAVGKALKFSQWDHRPLSAQQMHYAADDVRYLPLLYRTLGELLQQAGRESWAEQAMAELEDPGLYHDDPEQLSLKPRAVERLSLRERAVLRRLLAWRQNRAMQQDVPPRALVEDGVLTAMTYRPMRSVSDLGSIRGLPRDVEKLYGRELVETVALGMSDPLPDKPVEPADPEAHQLLVRKVWTSLEEFCKLQNVSVTLLGSKRSLSQWLMELQQAADGTRHPIATPCSRWDKTWRKELLTPWWQQTFAGWGLPLPTGESS